MLSCDDCKRLFKQHHKKDIDCEAECGGQVLKPENKLPRDLCVIYGIGFHNGQHALNINAILKVLELEQIAKEDHKFVLIQVITYFKGAFEGLRRVEGATDE